jgi:peptidyl-prolyl cis-trans isomerase A (cyclophilin A)
MKLGRWAACLTVAAFLFGGCKKKEVPAEAQPPAQPKAAETAQPPAPAPAEAPKTEEAKSPAPAPVPHGDDPSLLHPTRLKEQAPEKYQVRFDTTRGVFTVTVTRAWAPIGADRFYNLVKHHFFDNSAFFRVVPGFVVQFGISSYPKVSAAWKHTEIKDDPVTQSNKRGYLSFATAGANTRTTQVFINLKDNQRLDASGFAPFGVVDGQGMNVVEMLYDVYGDTAGPDQTQIEKQGEPYLKKGWPKLDYIKTATLVE